MSSRWDLYRASIPDLAELVASKDTPGWFRGFFRGEAGIGGHAEFEKVDLRKPATVLVAVSVAAGVLATLAAVKNAPRIKRWWDNEAAPAVKAVRDRITRRRGGDAEVPGRLALEAFSTGIDVTLDETKSSMSSAEAQRHLLEILMAASIIAESMRALSNARIEDDAELSDLNRAIDKLTTQQVTDTINRMLTADTFTVDGETSQILARTFGGGYIADGEYIPVSRDRIKQALSLSPR